MSNQIVVGVQPISGSMTADSMDEAMGSLRTHWCIIDGHEVPGSILGTKCETSAKFAVVEIRFIVAKYELADYREKDRYLLAKSTVKS